MHDGIPEICMCLGFLKTKRASCECTDNSHLVNRSEAAEASEIVVTFHGYAYELIKPKYRSNKHVVGRDGFGE
jgi:hypothetical protein